MCFVMDAGFMMCKHCGFHGTHDEFRAHRCGPESPERTARYLRSAF